MFLHYKDQSVNPERELIPACRKNQKEHANKLSNTMEKVLLEKLTVPNLVKRTAKCVK